MNKGSVFNGKKMTKTIYTNNRKKIYLAMINTALTILKKTKQKKHKVSEENIQIATQHLLETVDISELLEHFLIVVWTLVIYC